MTRRIASRHHPVHTRLPSVLAPAVEWRPIDSLEPHANNPRRHSDRQIRQLAASLREFGFTNPVLIDEQGWILAGHGRVEAARLLGLTKVPTLRLERMSETQRKAYVIADNRLAELADWDQGRLAIELKTLVETDFNVELTGFSTGEVDLILDGKPAETGPDPADDLSGLEVNGEAVSRSGDLWELGPIGCFVATPGTARPIGPCSGTSRPR